MSCPLCGLDEQRERCCWPMPASPLSFFADGSLFDDDAFDRQVLAERLGGGELDAVRFAEVLGVRRSCVWTFVKRGQIPSPKRREKCSGGMKALWSAEQVAGVLLARGMA